MTSVRPVDDGDNMGMQLTFPGAGGTVDNQEITLKEGELTVTKRRLDNIRRTIRRIIKNMT